MNNQLNLLLLCLRTLTFLAAIILSAFTSAEPKLEPFTSHDKGLLFTMHGSNTIGAQLAPNLVKDYLIAKQLKEVTVLPGARENEYRIRGFSGRDSVYVDIAAHGSSTGFKSLLNQQAHVAMSSRPIKHKEAIKLDYLGDMRSFSAEHVIAIDGLAVIVHPQNPVTQLNIEQVSQIFSGTVTNWKMVGGPDAPINLYARDNKSGTWDTFKNLVLRKKYQLSNAAKRFESNEQLTQYVSRDPNGIGFTGIATVHGVRALGIADNATQAIFPTLLSIATEDYPLSRRLFLYTEPEISNSHLQEFLDYTQSRPGQLQVKETGFIAQTPISLKPEDQRDGPEQYLELTENAHRLSVNFRFHAGSSRLDNKARQDILRLVSYMQTPDNANKRLVLIGFGDEKSSPERSKVLSKLRAIAVKSALHNHNITTTPVAGFGAYLPVAANDGIGRVKNQRVEVWVN